MAREGVTCSSHIGVSGGSRIQPRESCTESTFLSTTNISLLRIRILYAREKSMEATFQHADINCIRKGRGEQYSFSFYKSASFELYILQLQLKIT